MYSVIYAILLLFSLVYLIGFSAEGLNGTTYTSAMGTVLIIVLVSLIVLIIQNMTSPKGKKNEKVGVFTLFLLAYICVHFQTFTNMMVFDDFVDRFNVYGNIAVNLRTALISLIGLEAYLLGNSITLQKKTLPILNRRKVVIAQGKQLKTKTYFVLFCSVLIFAYLNGQTYLSGSYSQEMLNNMSGTMNAYSGILVDILLFSSILFQVYSIRDYSSEKLSLLSYFKSFSLLFYVSVVIYLGLVIISGDRGPIITFVLSMAFGYVMISKHRFRWVSLLIIIIFGGLVLSVIGIARADRTGGAYNLQSNEYVLTILNFNSVFPFTEELAGSNRTAIWAVESTPGEYPFRNGLFSLNHLLGIVPFSSSILNAVGININGNNHYGHSSSFLDWYTQGDNVTAGVGTSTVADIYLDFGVPGIVLVLFIMGLFFSRMDRITANYTPNSIPLIVMITCLVFFSNSVYLARSSVLPLFRNIVWLYILMLILIKTNNSKKIAV